MALFRYPGGKSKLRKQIVDELLLVTGTSEYREPFLGGGSICIEMMLRDPTPKSIWINDKDVGIAALWIAVREYPEDLKEGVRTFTPSTSAFYCIKEKLLHTNTLPVTRQAIVSLGLKKLIIHQISYSGLGTKSGSPLGGKEQKSAYKIDCRWSPNYLCKQIDKMSKLFSTFRMKISNVDFEALILDKSVPSCIYVDPPYYVKGNDLYQCGFTVEDHVRLAGLLQETKHAWVLSYDDCPDIRQLYAWAHLRTIQEVQYSITSSRVKPELLIMAPNMRLPEASLDSLFDLEECV